MVENFTAIQNLLVTRIANDLHNDTNGVLDMVLNAYNRYQEDERDGVDYIFDIRKGEDLKCCIDGGMTAHDISRINEECTSTAKSTPYFMFGANHETAEVIPTWEQLKQVLCVSLHEVISCVLMYVTRCTEYQALYEHYITEYLERKDFGK